MDRHKSLYFQLRQFHNNVKRSYYTKYANKSDNVLEIGIGKGGDLGKLINRNVSEIWGIDIDHDSLEEAYRRFKTMGRQTRLVLHKADLTTRKVILPEKHMNLVNSHFSFHYFMGTPHSFDNVIQIITHSIKPGGYFVISSFDSSRVVTRVKTPFINPEKFSIKIIKYTPGELFGNEIRVTMKDHDLQAKNYQPSTEFLIDFDLLNRVMFFLGFDVVSDKFFDRLPGSGKMTQFEKDISFLNRIVVYTKT